MPPRRVCLKDSLSVLQVPSDEAQLRDDVAGETHTLFSRQYFTNKKHSLGSTVTYSAQHPTKSQCTLIDATKGERNVAASSRLPSVFSSGEIQNTSTGA